MSEKIKVQPGVFRPTTPVDSEQKPLTENEQLPRVVIEFCGFSHNGINIEAVPRILDTFSKHLAVWGEDTTLFFESPVTTPAEAKEIQRLVDLYGFTAVMLKPNLPTHESLVPNNRNLVNAKIAEIDAGLELGQVDISKIDLDDMQLYLLRRGFDDMRSGTRFSYQLEAHSPESIAKVESLMEESDSLSQTAIEAFRQGRFQDFTRYAMAGDRFSTIANNIREEAIAETLKKQIKNLLSDKDKRGSFFILMGRGHVGILEKTKHKLRSKAVEFVNTTGPDELMVNLTPSQDLLSKIFIAGYFKTIADAEDLGEVLRYMHIFDTIKRQAETIASGISEVEQERLCSEHVNLVDYFRGKGFTF